MAGAPIRVKLYFSERVIVSTQGGVPSVTLRLDDDPTDVHASYAENRGNGHLVFEHTCTKEQAPVRTVRLVPDSLSLNGGGIASVLGPAAGLAHPGATKRIGHPLTVRLAPHKPAHNGSGVPFHVNVDFSHPVTITRGAVLRDHGFLVTGGTIVNAWKRPMPNGSKGSANWTIRLLPDSRAPMTVTARTDRDCSEPGAFCTAAGIRLTHAPPRTIPGPVSELRVEDAEVQEALGAELKFNLFLNVAMPYQIVVSYRTADGTATAGEDYTAVNGIVYFRPGETRQTVTVPVLDDTHHEGSETLMLELFDPQRVHLLNKSATGTIHNTDPMPQAWIARFGRTVADQVLDAVKGRMGSARTPGTEVTVAGQRLGGEALDADALERREAEARIEGSREVTGRELLAGSSFALTGGSAEGGFGALWGRAAVSDFDGREDDLTLDGEVTSAMLGADWAVGRGSAGLILSYSRGEGGFRAEAGGGEVESTLTGLYPWGRYEVSERLTAWGVVGYGTGELVLKPDRMDAIETDMNLMMAALGGRGVLAQASPEGGLELAATSDAMVVRTTSEEVRGNRGSLAGSEADVSRLRLGLEGTWRGLGTLVPTLEIGARLDGGDAEIGFGADIGGRLVWADPSLGIRAELAARGLLTHEDGGLSERGFVGSLAWDPSPDTDRGPSLTISQAVGAEASGGMDALLRPDAARALAANGNGDDPRRRRLEARFGYGIAMFGGRFTGTPEVSLDLSDAGRDYGLGWRVTRAGSGPGSLEVALEATLRESANDAGAAVHDIGLRVTARW